VRICECGNEHSDSFAVIFSRMTLLQELISCLGERKHHQSHTTPLFRVASANESRTLWGLDTNSFLHLAPFNFQSAMMRTAILPTECIYVFSMIKININYYTTQY
jgi:hypothetical protein